MVAIQMRFWYKEKVLISVCFRSVTLVQSWIVISLFTYSHILKYGKGSIVIVQKYRFFGESIRMGYPELKKEFCTNRM